MSNSIKKNHPVVFTTEIAVPISSSSDAPQEPGAIRDNDGLERWNGTSWEKVGSASVYETDLNDL